MSRLVPTLLVATAVTLFGLAGLSAQEAGAPPPPAGFHHRHHQCGDLDAHLAARLAYAEVKLGVTDTQRPAWKKLVEALKTAAEPLRKACAVNQGAPSEAVDLPGRLAHAQRRAEARAAALKIAVPAVEQFYAALSPEQKKIADELLQGHRGGAGHHAHR